MLIPDLILLSTFLFPGTDTVLTAQLWVFLYMAAFPDVQADIQKQIDQVVGHHRMPTLQDEKALSLLSKYIVPRALMHIITFNRNYLCFSVGRKRRMNDRKEKEEGNSLCLDQF